jgi:hypothetical protein
MRTRHHLHIALWCSLFAIFVALAIPTVGPAVRANRIGPIDPNHSTDSYLAGLTHVRDGSRLFANLIDTIPPNKSIVVFVNAESSPSEFLGMLVAYLSWPLDVRIIKVRTETFDREMDLVKSSSAAGFFFCSVQPPSSFSGGTHFGSEIVFVPGRGFGSGQ